MLHRLTVVIPFRWWMLIAGTSIVFLAGCHTPPPAPVYNRPAPPSEKINEHLVSQGETLFSIAWRYEKDISKLARANGLSRPYTIYRGQRLNLDTSRVPKYVKKPVSKKKSSTSPAQSQNKPNKNTSQQKTKPAPALPKNWQWQWPVQGNVTKRFNSSTLFKGIDIQSFSGAPVVAAGSGVVVYSGSGLRGYGKLIIIKHSGVFLSAYAHNRKIFVKEGQLVKSGQKISDVGGDPSNKRRLYFEIRRDGKPVDPMRYLPKR